MTPVGELCTRLDELGIEHDDSIVGAVSWGNAEYEQYCDGLTRLVVLYATPAQAIAATVGSEPDDATMLKLHDEMNAALLEYERSMGIENGDGAITVPFVARMHELLEKAATVETELRICKRCGVAYELDILDKGFGKSRFCPNCGYKEMYQ